MNLKNKLSTVDIIIIVLVGILLLKSCNIISFSKGKDDESNTSNTTVETAATRAEAAATRAEAAADRAEAAVPATSNTEETATGTDSSDTSTYMIRRNMGPMGYNI